ncbi:hypothetical protein JTE90_009107 [Oedothorax gibbosus]|uniref:Protein pellino n=1 Tax=Oedothorax gibbosus TaxID=931172 RepID=A0AAV6UF33_9ARAC|nr:hypothetical protein JTE90_009107 [Oedothorax gibbosus]
MPYIKKLMEDIELASFNNCSGPPTSQQENSSNESVYGELVILGYNGSLPQGSRGRRRNKFVLKKRETSNGVKEYQQYLVQTPKSSKSILDSQQYCISYTMSNEESVIVEYKRDENTDMFQIGRSSETPIDFVVMDTTPGERGPDGKPTESTISRFACRLLVERENNHTVRVYAAGFDSIRNIFLGEKATKWRQSDEIDGLTTNGVLIMRPKSDFFKDVSSTPARHRNILGVWREVSVNGGVFALRESRSAQQRGVKHEDDDNSLIDGTLIDLCGATLLWRSAEGLSKSPTKKILEEKIDDLNAGRPQCPVSLNTLVIPRRSTLSVNDKQPYVYLNCGHVQGLHEWGQDRESNVRTCPMCLKVGPVVKLMIGIEPSFYVDVGPPNFAFNPCGHMATENTVKYWASVPIPHGTCGFHTICPFCATPLTKCLGYVKLIFQDYVD